ncbi:MAG TPA: hypothetical protein DCQ97_02090 [Chitinophagaceae bacterium]|nr:hypothetical protein [Chitinophagaceae bacterium]
MPVNHVFIHNTVRPLLAFGGGAVFLNTLFVDPSYPPLYCIFNKLIIKRINFELYYLFVKC